MSKYNDFVGDTLLSLKEKLNSNNEMIERDFNEVKNTASGNKEYLENKVNANEDDIENKHKEHLESTAAHPSENITYEGKVTGTNNVKDAVDNVQDQVKAIVAGGTEVDPRVSQALVDSEGTVHENLKERLDDQLGRTKKLEEDTQDEKKSEVITNTESIFTLGKGLNKKREPIELELTSTYGPVKEVVIGGITDENLVKSSNMDKDTDGDGVVDDFKDGGTDAVITATRSFSTTFGAQVIEITNSTGVGEANVVSDFISVDLNDVVSVSIQSRVQVTNGNIVGRFSVQIYDSSKNYLETLRSADVTNTAFNIIKFENIQITNPNAKYVLLKTSARTTASGDTGRVWYRKAKVRKSDTVGHYISTGVKSTANEIAIESVGINRCPYFNSEWTLLNGAFFDGEYIVLPDENSEAYTPFIPVKVISDDHFIGTKYVFECLTKNSSLFYDSVRHYDENFIPVTDSELPTGRSRSFTNDVEAGGEKYYKLPKDIRYIRILFRRHSTYAPDPYKIKKLLVTNNYEDIKDGTYEYKKSRCFIKAPKPPRSVGNVKGEVNLETKTLTKKYSDDYVIQSSDYLSMDTSLPAVDYITYILPNDCIDLGPSNIATRQVNVPSKSETVYSIDIPVTDVGEFFTYSSSGVQQRIAFVIEKGTVTTARAEIEGLLAVTYQLAEVKMLPCKVSGSLPMNFGKGTTVERIPYHKDEHTYDGSKGGLVFENPISKIDKIEKLLDGKIVEIPFTPTISDDGLSATIMELQDNDVVEVYAPIRPEEDAGAEISYIVDMNSKSTLLNAVAMTQKNERKISSLEDFVALAYTETQLALAMQNARITALENK
ncbi:hypothetical protein [Anaeromicrobium sediminis]|uniref:Uncharacterized protein n=1 Tax=Anaeromicrobium sediminis TaxID=1478221 RepID=A0A267MNZ0_9FIRM|nr:hypothetical protein [Anaeromicrobium sediminis]PAB61314.1 hypothetical protein CCE28_02460 [Anaeromicrobium sediminis]